MIQNIKIEDLNNEVKTAQLKVGELLNVTQTQNIKKINDYNKDTVINMENPTFKIEKNLATNNKNETQLMEMTDSKMESIQIKNTENNIKKLEENEINNKKTNKSIKSFKESIKKDNGLEDIPENNDINVNQSYSKEMKREEISLNDVNIKSLRLGNTKISCEFIGKDNSSCTSKLKQLPNNVETTV